MCLCIIRNSLSIFRRALRLFSRYFQTPMNSTMSVASAKKEFTFKLERSMNCKVHSSIHIYEPISAIIDTPEMQRLRRISQLGLISLVYPTCDHKRFVHSLGTYHLAMQFMKQLCTCFPDKVDGRDALCVGIAALCHDIGHGPFSHTFDGPFMTAANPNRKWTHEEGSIAMLKYLFEQNKEVKDKLDEYLDPEDYVFIYELINPPKEFLNDKKEWILRGRPIEKAFLYDILSNHHESIDVDKMDYFVRDSLGSKVPISFSIERAHRILKDVSIQLTDDGYNRLIYNSKNIDDLATTMNCRKELHSKIYQHKTGVGLDIQLVDILLLANEHLRFIGSNGQAYRMSDAVNDMSAYVQMTDSVIDLIRNSRSEELEPARRLLKDMECRKLYKCLQVFNFRKLSKANHTEIRVNKFFSKLGISSDRYVIRKACVHQGKGIDESPLRHVWVFDPKEEKNTPRRITKAMLKCIDLPAGFVRLFVFWRDNVVPDELKAEFNLFLDFEFPKSLEVGEK